MVQSINWPAIRLVPRVLFRQPSLALPHMEVATVADLDFRCLQAAGCAGVIFDKDNTLTDPYVDTVHPSLAAALKQAREAFGEGNVAVLSNSAGTPDDPNYAAADRLEASLGLPVLRRPEKKPKGFESVRRHFGPNVDPAALVMIGDRYLTDVTFGNLHGMLCVRTGQLTQRGDNPVAQAMRRLEVLLVALFRWARVAPMPHRLASAVRTRCISGRPDPRHTEGISAHPPRTARERALLSLPAHITDGGSSVWRSLGGKSPWPRSRIWRHLWRCQQGVWSRARSAVPRCAPRAPAR
jgi:phosphatidylglycerophosphatase GEP4